MIIVIGGTSFIGIHTVDYLLRKGEDVLVTARNNKLKNFYESKGVKYINLDLTNTKDFEKLPKTNVKGVILLAGLLPANVTADLKDEENGKDYFEVNTIGTINVLEYCRSNNIKKVISTSSYADVQNSWRVDPAITEYEPRNYRYDGDHAAYIFSKNAACDMLEYYNYQHGMNNSYFRLPPVYGVGPHGFFRINGKLVKSGLQKFIEQAQKGEDIIIYGDKKASRDVVYVKDVARAFYNAINNDNAKGLYNITSGVSLTLEKQALIISEVFSENNKLSNILNESTKPNNITPYLFSIEKAKKDFNYIPVFSDFKLMMEDYKKDLKQNKYNDLFS